MSLPFVTVSVVPSVATSNDLSNTASSLPLVTASVLLSVTASTVPSVTTLIISHKSLLL